MPGKLRALSVGRELDLIPIGSIKGLVHIVPKDPFILTVDGDSVRKKRLSEFFCKRAESWRLTRILNRFYIHQAVNIDPSVTISHRF